jgi:tetratricopeptide (TPR) repeat protein
MSGQESKAHDVWLEALACFKNNAYFSAWIRYNLATTGLNNLDPQSERHLLAALHNTKKASAQGVQSPVWSGLARFRCLSGDWKRAEFAYLQSLNSAIGPADKQIAYRGLVTTYYLSGQQDKALETLEEALQEPGMAHFLLFVLQAKAYLKCGQIDKARAVLERVGTPNFEMERWEWRIAQAELARSQDHLDEAVALLEGLPLHTLHAREEVRLFPKLFALLEASGREIPKPLDYIEQTKVQVSAQGVLHVWVNNRPVEIVPTGRVGELLVYLLEQGGQTSLEHIAAAIYPEVFEAAKRRKLIWKLVNGLREALGWEDSVVALRGAYQLDPSALWHYDIAQARAKGEFAGEFLAGVYSQWVIEVGQELQNLAPLARRLDLN